MNIVVATGCVGVDLSCSLALAIHGEPISFFSR